MTDPDRPADIGRDLLAGVDALAAAQAGLSGDLQLEEVGVVTATSRGVVTVTGLADVAVDETVVLGAGALGLVRDLRSDELGVVLLSGGDSVTTGTSVRRTGAALSVPVGDGLLGRVIDPLGETLDNKGPLAFDARLNVERPATPLVDRAPVNVPLQTGVKVVDALFPIGRGQRELIIGDRQTGKTALALAAILAQQDTGVLCVYCSIGRRGAETSRIIAQLQESGALDYTTVMVASAEAQPGVRQVAPFAATSVAEAWMERGRDVLIVYDDLVQHARSHREVSLLLRRPPGREAYPGDIFYLHARLLERATQLKAAKGGGSLTALPVVETQERDLAAYVPTNLISITDGQLVLSGELFRRGQLPAVDVGLSVSRVGGKAQLGAYREVAGGVRLTHSQFEELERFAQLGADLDESTRSTLVRGRRVREVLKQGATEITPVPEQLITLLAVNEGLFDALPVERIGAAEDELGRSLRLELPDVVSRITAGERLAAADRERLLDLAGRVIEAAGFAP